MNKYDVYIQKGPVLAIKSLDEITKMYGLKTAMDVLYGGLSKDEKDKIEVDGSLNMNELVRDRIVSVIKYNKDSRYMFVAMDNNNNFILNDYSNLNCFTFVKEEDNQIDSKAYLFASEIYPAGLTKEKLDLNYTSLKDFVVPSNYVGKVIERSDDEGNKYNTTVIYSNGVAMLYYNDVLDGLMVGYYDPRGEKLEVVSDISEDLKNRYSNYENVLFNLQKQLDEYAVGIKVYDGGRRKLK